MAKFITKPIFFPKKRISMPVVHSWSWSSINLVEPERLCYVAKAPALTFCIENDGFFWIWSKVLLIWNTDSKERSRSRHRNRESSSSRMLSSERSQSRQQSRSMQQSREMSWSRYQSRESRSKEQEKPEQAAEQREQEHAVEQGEVREEAAE
jgi:hypothetical protein